MTATVGFGMSATIVAQSARGPHPARGVGSNPASGYLANPMREDLMRAGHAHAGVIILLSLIAQLLADGARAPAGFLWAVRIAFPCAAVLMSAGFFLSVTGAPSATQPGAMIGLVYVGGGVLAAAVAGLAVGLLRSLRNG